MDLQRPAIFNLPLSTGEIRPKTGPKAWGWVNIWHLSQILNLRPSQIVEQFGFLSKETQTKDMIAVTAGREIKFYTIPNLVTLLKIVEGHGWQLPYYVPAGWSEAIIDFLTGQRVKQLVQQAEVEAKRAISELSTKGYTVLNLTRTEGGTDQLYELTIERINDKWQKRLQYMMAELEHDLVTMTLKYQYVLYDPTRFKEYEMPTGREYEEEFAYMVDNGYFVVAQDTLGRNDQYHMLGTFQPK